MSGSIASNPNVPHVSTPLADTQSLVSVVTQLKQGVESLGGHRGAPNDRAVTFNDLTSLTNRVTALEGTSKTPTAPTTPTSSPTSDITALQASVTDLTYRVSALETTSATLVYQMAQTTDQIAQLWTNSTYQQGLIDTLNSQVATIITQVSALNSAVSTIQSQVTTLNSEVATINSRLAAAGIP